MTVAVHLINRQVPSGGPVIEYRDRTFIPKALWSIAIGSQSPDTFIDGARCGLGWGAEGPTQGYVGYRMDDNDTIPGGKDDISVSSLWGHGAATFVEAANLLSFEECGERVDWNGSGNVLNDDILSCAFAGDNFQSAAGQFDLPMSGSVTVSGLPFAPKFVAVAHNAGPTLGGEASSGHHGLGFSDGTNHRSISIVAPLALSHDVKGKLRDDAITHWDHGSVPFVSAISFTGDGFTLTPSDYPDANSIKHIWFACSLDGSVVVGHDTSSTSTGNDPTLVLLASAMTTSTGAVQSNKGLSYGILTDRVTPTSVATLKQGATWMGAVDGAGTSNTKRRYSISKSLLFADCNLNTGAGGVVGEADGQLVSGGFNLNWTTGGPAYQFMYASLEIGEGPTSVCFGWTPKQIRYV